MSDKIVVSRYAEAFLGYARENKGVEKAIEDLQNFRMILRDNPDFQSFLENPAITHLEKRDLVKTILGDDFAAEFYHFICLLLEKARINCFHDIAEYARVQYAHEGELDVLLRTSFPLELELIKAIETKLAARFGKKLKFYIELDGDLLGGVQVVMGNTVIDATVRRRLDDLHETLSNIRV